MESNGIPIVTCKIVEKNVTIRMLQSVECVHNHKFPQIVLFYTQRYFQL